MRTVLLMVFAFSISVEAQTRMSESENLFLKSTELAAQPRKPMLTGVLSEDLFVAGSGLRAKDSIAHIDNVETRSALKAGVFSLLIPGAGQAYNHDYWVAAGFFAVEVAAWAVDFIWTTKANNKEKYYMSYADGTASDNYQNAHYSVVRYAQWIKNNVTQLEQYNQTTQQGQQIIAQQIPILINGSVSPSEPPWQQVNWDALNTIEANMGGYFTHQLFPHGNFEYYELIGKYPQFRQGWVDSPYALWLNGGQTGAAPIDYNPSDTPDSRYYMDQRGLANNLFSVASTALGVVLVNHFASAIEAAIAAHVYNKNIHTHVSMSELPMGMGYQTQFKVAVDF